MSSNPFAASTSSPGAGKIHVALLPPSKHVLQELSYQYPLKLIAPTPISLSRSGGHGLIYTVFLLTYGGGLVAGDQVDLRVQLDGGSRLILLTQGSTKVFKSEATNILTRQCMTVDLRQDATLCYLPDPVQPFADCCFEQRQVYRINGTGTNLCVLDWVSEGRTARGEHWDFHSYTSSNEIWRCNADGSDVLMIRDNLILDNRGRDVRDRMHDLGIYATLILGGPLMLRLGRFFLDEFKQLPRIGARKWADSDVAASSDAADVWRAARVPREQSDGILWTAAATRGFTVVKFGAFEVQGAKHWLKSMLEFEGSVEAVFGERALLCLR